MDGWGWGLCASQDPRAAPMALSAIRPKGLGHLPHPPVPRVTLSSCNPVVTGGRIWPGAGLQGLGGMGESRQGSWEPGQGSQERAGTLGPGNTGLRTHSFALMALYSKVN